MRALSGRSVAVLGIAVLAAGLSWGRTTWDFSRYEMILERQPFGEPPTADAGLPVEPVRPDEIPVFAKSMRLCALTESALGLRVGFVDIKEKPPKTFFLYVGETQDGVTVVSADYEKGEAVLRQGAEEWPVTIHGAKTADTPSQKAVTLAAIANKGKTDTKAVSYTQRLKARRELVRHREVEGPKLTGDALKEHLQEYQMELIRNGMPPLPMALTKEMDEKLVLEGVLPPQAQTP